MRRWKTVRGSNRAELQALFAANRRLFKAYVLREQLDRLWTYKTRPGVLNFLNGWCDALRWQRLPELDRLSEFLFKHLDGIAAYCDHQVRFGVVESINTTIKPREKSKMHGHPATVAVFLTDVHSRFTYPDVKTEEITGKAGQVVYFDAFEHDPEHLSNQPFEAIAVELKP